MENLDLESIINHPDEKPTCRSIHRKVKKKIELFGIIHRLFSRVKTKKSIIHKIKNKNYKYIHEEKKIQDLFGVRAVVYFSDDIEICKYLLDKKFNIVSTNITQEKEERFGPHNYNIVVEIPDLSPGECYFVKKYDFIDSTFEVQIRSVLSEGWHEVDHDLRYKRQSDWEEHEDLSRAFNSIMATLENCDRSILHVFDELAERHYEEGNFQAMVRSKLRLRFAPSPGSDDVWNYIGQSPRVAEQIYQTDRKKLLKSLIDTGISVPITLENIVFIINRTQIADGGLKDLEPQVIQRQLDKYASSQWLI